MLGRHRNRRGDEMWRNRAYVEVCRERDAATARASELEARLSRRIEERNIAEAERDRLKERVAELEAQLAIATHPSPALVMARDGDVEVLRGRFDLARRRGYPSDKCGTAPIENAMARATVTEAGPWVELRALVEELYYGDGYPPQWGARAKAALGDTAALPEVGGGE